MNLKALIYLPLALARTDPSLAIPSPTHPGHTTLPRVLMAKITGVPQLAVVTATFCEMYVPPAIRSAALCTLG